MLLFTNKKIEALGEGVACQAAIWGKAAMEPRALVSSDAMLLMMTPHHYPTSFLLRAFIVLGSGPSMHICCLLLTTL